VGWHFDTAIGIQLAKEAVETNFWPLFEVENGQYKINYKPKERAPLTNWLKQQGRFKHLFKPGNEGLLEELQVGVDTEWQKLLKLAGEDEAPGSQEKKEKEKGKTKTKTEGTKVSKGA
jgi:pyruvate ferredoxin oxidoreductase beta subunit